MTVDNVTQILSKIPGHKWAKVMGGVRLDIPLALLKEIQMRYSTDTEKNHACADYYVNYHPDADWDNLTAGLYSYEEFALARESKSFISTGKNTATIHCHSILTCLYNMKVLSLTRMGTHTLITPSTS